MRSLYARFRVIYVTRHLAICYTSAPDISGYTVRWAKRQPEAIAKITETAWSSAIIRTENTCATHDDRSCPSMT